MPRYTLGQLQNLMRQVGWPESEISRGSAIFMYESGGNSDVINDGSSTNSTEYSVGLAQINTLWHKRYSVAQLKDPIINLTEALRIWRGRPNWQDWKNSKAKYDRDYQGIASQSRQIYSGGYVAPLVITDKNINHVIANAQPAHIEETETDKTALYIGLALLGLFVVARR